MTTYIKNNRIATIIAIILIAIGFQSLASALTIQDNWRKCKKCKVIFYNGYSKKGICAGGGSHIANSPTNYRLTYDKQGNGQSQWRYCSDCQALFYNGYTSKGICTPGKGHTAAGFNFNLSYGATAKGERNWRFCNKCQDLFFSGEKGSCQAGGTHIAAGFLFALDYRGGGFTDDVILNPINN